MVRAMEWMAALRVHPMLWLLLGAAVGLVVGELV
jgi:hypothetical protein